jgi:hypothetical protein
MIQLKEYIPAPDNADHKSGIASQTLGTQALFDRERLSELKVDSVA